MRPLGEPNKLSDRGVRTAGQNRSWSPSHRIHALSGKTLVSQTLNQGLRQAQAQTKMAGISPYSLSSRLILERFGPRFAGFWAINFVVVRVELDYKYPLTSGDRFWVGLNVGRESRIKIAFYQDVYRLPDNKLILKGKVIGTAINKRGRPELPPEVEALMPQLANDIASA